MLKKKCSWLVWTYLKDESEQTFQHTSKIQVYRRTKNRQRVSFPPKQNKLKDLILEADNDEAAEVYNTEYIPSTGWLNSSSCSATQYTQSTVIYFIYQQSTASLILSKCWIGNSSFCSFWGHDITRVNTRQLVRTDFRHPFWHKDISLSQSDNDTRRKSKHVSDTHYTQWTKSTGRSHFYARNIFLKNTAQIEYKISI
jgi:hypothetical protein